MKLNWRWQVVVASFICAAGCGTLDPALRVETFGMADPGRDAMIATTAEAYKGSPPVLVTQGEIPEGMDVQEENSKLVVLPGYGTSRHAAGCATCTDDSGRDDLLTVIPTAMGLGRIAMMSVRIVVCQSEDN